MEVISDNYGYILSMIGVFWSIAMLLRSLFFFLTAYSNLNKTTYYALSFSLIAGISHVMYNYEIIVKSKTNWLFITFLLGTSIVFYLYAKNQKDVQYSIAQISKDAYSLIETSLVDKFTASSELESISYSDLKELQYDKVYSKNGVLYIRRRTKYNGLFFETIMSPGAGMGMQEHPGCVEYCLTIEGELIDRITGFVYPRGKWATWKPREPHAPENNSHKDKLILHVYFKEVI